MGDVAKGFRLGCGGAVGVVAGLAAIGLGGCLCLALLAAHGAQVARERSEREAKAREVARAAAILGSTPEAEPTEIAEGVTVVTLRRTRLTNKDQLTLAQVEAGQRFVVAALVGDWALVTCPVGIGGVTAGWIPLADLRPAAPE